MRHIQRLLTPPEEEGKGACREGEQGPCARLGDLFETDLAVLQVVDHVVLLEEADAGVEIKSIRVTKFAILDDDLVVGGDKLEKVSVASGEGKAGKFEVCPGNQMDLAVVVGDEKFAGHAADVLVVNGRARARIGGDAEVRAEVGPSRC